VANTASITQLTESKFVSPRNNLPPVTSLEAIELSQPGKSTGRSVRQFEPLNRLTEACHDA
jgi:hypothetical protein